MNLPNNTFTSFLVYTIRCSTLRDTVLLVLSAINCAEVVRFTKQRLPKANPVLISLEGVGLAIIASLVGPSKPI